MATGQVTDTYVAALQHDLVDLPADTTRVGVVRRPTHWLNAQVDENIPALGPPDALLDDVKDRHEALKAAGRADAAAHNRAMDTVDYDERYREHLSTPEAEAALDDLLARLESGENIALVCFENTAEKRCHRTILREVLESRLEGE